MYVNRIVKFNDIDKELNWKKQCFKIQGDFENKKELVEAVKNMHNIDVSHIQFGF